MGLSWQRRECWESQTQALTILDPRETLVPLGGPGPALSWSVLKLVVAGWVMALGGGL